MGFGNYKLCMSCNSWDMNHRQKLKLGKSLKSLTRNYYPGPRYTWRNTAAKITYNKLI